jgi:hypothetical protein
MLEVHKHTYPVQAQVLHVLQLVPGVTSQQGWHGGLLAHHMCRLEAQRPDWAGMTGPSLQQLLQAVSFLLHLDAPDVRVDCWALPDSPAALVKTPSRWEVSGSEDQPQADILQRGEAGRLHGSDAMRMHVRAGGL